MLVLTRKENEKILIGDNIVVTLVRIRGNVIRLGIEAPSDVRILRAELPPLERLPTKVLADVTFVEDSNANVSGDHTNSEDPSHTVHVNSAPLGRFFLAPWSLR